MPEQLHVTWNPKCGKAELYPSQKREKALLSVAFCHMGTQDVFLEEGAFVK
jgi:hypothetical protein